MNKEIKRLIKKAEEEWASYSLDVCLEIQEYMRREECRFDNSNFYEFCKGYVFANLKTRKKRLGRV